MPLVSVAISLNVQQLKYRYYRDYVDGWFEYYDEKARLRFEAQHKLHHMNDKEYKNKTKVWENLISDNSVKNYLTANAQLLQIIKYLPVSFKNRFPSPTQFDAFNVKKLSYKGLKCLINRLSSIPSFCLITYTSITYKYINRLLKHYEDDKYIDIPMGVYIENDIPFYNQSLSSSTSNRKRKRDEIEDNNNNNHHCNQKKQKLNGNEEKDKEKEKEVASIILKSTLIIKDAIPRIDAQQTEEDEIEDIPSLPKNEAVSSDEDEVTIDDISESNQTQYIKQELINDEIDHDIDDMNNVHNHINNNVNNNNNGIIDKNSMKHWNHYAIIYWLNRVKHGKFAHFKYTNLRKHIFMSKLKGYDLNKINNVTLKLLDINDRFEQNLILDSIFDLIINDNYKNLAYLHIKTDNIPFEYIDPISYEIMIEPVIVKSTGYIHEKKSIQQFILTFGKDPILRKDTFYDDIIPNQQLKLEIDRWRQRNIY